ncbi:integrator complex subunit 15-like isoform X2 [Dreissena polymorpha]|nr:integrator complex subunit 15-like isoform X2 [Dreissena polymorpha]
MPARGSGEKLAMDIAQQYIVDIAKKRGHRNKKLDSIHELLLLELVCSSLRQAPEHSCYSVFAAIFGGHVDASKIVLMTKLVSMAISISCGPVLGCVALWMQEQGSQSQYVCDMAQRLVEDYCQLYPSLSSSFRNLPAVSTLFTCNFVTALTTIYPYTDASKSSPLELLECIVDWISADPCLCSDSVRLVRIQSSFTCPLAGLIRWCILGPIVTMATNDGNGTEKKSVTHDSKLLSLFSKLHLGVLLSLQAYQSMELKEHLFSFGDMNIVSKTLAAFYRGGQCSEDMLDVVNVSVDRLAQTLQMALTTKALSEKFDFQQVSAGLPPNRLLEMIVSLGYRKQTQAQPMDVS